MIKKADVVHIHASNPMLKLLYVITSRVFKTKCLLTVHGKYGIYTTWKNIIHRWALTWCDVPILINKESYNAVKAFNPNAVFIPAFLPPIEEEENLTKEIEERVIQIKADGKPLFATNASSRAFTDDGREIYGIDFLIEFFKQHNGYNLVILDPTGAYEQQYADKLSENVHIITGKYSFCGLIKLSDYVVRNTATDGDSFSVKEALWYHKPTLVTDVVSRPEGVFLFKYNDEQSFNEIIEQATTFKGEIRLKEADGIALHQELYKRYGVC